jgi:hypothetical protein
MSIKGELRLFDLVATFVHDLIVNGTRSLSCRCADGRWDRGKVYRHPPSFGNDERGDANAQMAPAARNRLSICVLK